MSPQRIQRAAEILREQADLMDCRAIREGFDPEGKAFYDEMLALAQELEALGDDSARLDYLEREANEEPLTLHNLLLGSKMPSTRGLGLGCTGRTLREAIDQIRSAMSDRGNP